MGSSLKTATRSNYTKTIWNWSKLPAVDAPPVSWPATVGHPGDILLEVARFVAHQLGGPQSRAMTINQYFPNKIL